MKTLRELTLLVAGVGLAVFGLGAALKAPTGPGPQEALPPTTTTQVAQQVVEVPLDTNRIEVAGLPASVANVLADSGYAGTVTESALIETLPPSVVRVLIDSGATLTVAEGS